MTNSYLPQIEDGPEPLYARLVDAIARDIENGKLSPGDQLPPHRQLSQRLGIAIGTVSKAYSEAEDRGLLTGTVGRGSFVTSTKASAEDDDGGPVDLSRNVPPPLLAARRLARAFTDLRDRPELASAIGYTAPDGLDFVREAGARWLNRSFGLEVASADRLIQCNGGQHALHLTLSVLTKPGDVIITDAATFFGMRMLAQHHRLAVHGIAMDEQGIIPAALSEASARTGAKVVYVMPSLQNPTARTMGAERRRELVAVARRQGLILIEDEAYRPFLTGSRDPALVDLAPETTFYVATMSKSLCPGIRLGFVLPPAEYRDRIIAAAQATGYSPAPLGGLVFAQWEADGTAQALLEETRAEVQARTELARAELGEGVEWPDEVCLPHIWMPMDILGAQKLAAACSRMGIQVTPPEIPIVDTTVISGVRLCLGAPKTRQALSRALKVIAACRSDSLLAADLSFM